MSSGDTNPSHCGFAEARCDNDETPYSDTVGNRSFVIQFASTLLRWNNDRAERSLGANPRKNLD